jgi:hypothetical protein
MPSCSHVSPGASTEVDLRWAANHRAVNHLAVRHLAEDHLAVNHRATTAGVAKRNFIKKGGIGYDRILRATTAHAKMINSSGRIFELCRNLRFDRAFRNRKRLT